MVFFFCLFNLLGPGWKRWPLYHCIKHQDTHNIWGESVSLRATQPRAFLLLSWVISLVLKYQTWYLSQSRRSWATPPSRLLSICALNLQRFVNNPSNKQTDFQAGKQQRKNHHPNMEPGSSRWSHFDISSPTLLVSKVMCCQLAGLIGMEGRPSLGGGRGVPPRAHLAQERCVELTRVLCSGLSRTLLTAALAKSSPYGSKQSKVLLTLQTWLQFRFYREALGTLSGYRNSDQDHWDPGREGRPLFFF